MNKSQEMLADYFGALVSKGWQRKEAIEATAQASGMTIEYVEEMVKHRG